MVCADVEIVAIGGLQRSFGRRGHVGSLGLTRIELTVFADNASAIALYRKFRFEVDGTHRRYALRDGVWVDAFFMARLKL